MVNRFLCSEKTIFFKLISRGIERRRRKTPLIKPVQWTLLIILVCHTLPLLARTPGSDAGKTCMKRRNNKHWTLVFFFSSSKNYFECRPDLTRPYRSYRLYIGTSWSSWSQNWVSAYRTEVTKRAAPSLLSERGITNSDFYFVFFLVSNSSVATPLPDLYEYRWFRGTGSLNFRPSGPLFQGIVDGTPGSPRPTD